MKKIKKSIVFFLLVFTYISCKKEVKNFESDEVYVECNSKKDSLIIKIGSKIKLNKIFLDYRFGMNSLEFDELTLMYIQDGTLKKNTESLWFPLVNKTVKDRKQYFEVTPVFENDRLVEINLDSPFSHPDYNHFGLLSSKYGKPYYDFNCSFVHESFWAFQDVIISYTESNSEGNSQHITYSDINFIKRKSANYLTKSLKEEQKRIEDELKFKDSLNKKENLINNAF
jgi:hypothetical protein